MSLKIYWERISEKQAVRAKDHLNNLFANINKPDIIGDIKITNLSFGSKPPQFQIISISDPDPKILGSQSPSGIEARVKFSYDGDAYFMFETELIVNTPTPKFICFPISVKVSSPHFSGIASVIYDTDKVCFCLLSEDGSSPLKDLKLDTQLGDTSQHVLMNLDKLESFIVEQLREQLQKHLVFPNRITLPIEL
ncbi:hypothetical protein CYY_009716 [Polysphondylium violaceum]|uniref:SMP-LTD domain-containing protein n=1 Tax=Polysphondylium violaceum TaxID=133409 RepID=A0A8J4PLB1_9MYCE|nr:hypothetical protein CYY_009716 [Polysphondylium violaceum]